MTGPLRRLRDARAARRTLPDRARAALGSGERALAWAETPDGTVVVGTRERLLVVGEQPQAWGWEQVHRADWDTDESTLTVEPVADFGASLERRVLELPEPGDLVTLVRERVTSTVVVSQRVELGRRRGFRVIGRRAPGSTEVTWAFELDAGVDPTDPAVEEATRRALAEARASVGL